MSSIWRRIGLPSQPGGRRDRTCCGIRAWASCVRTTRRPWRRSTFARLINRGAFETAKLASDEPETGGRDLQAAVADEPTPFSAVGPDGDFATLIGANLRRLRNQSNLSLEKLSRAAGVSRAMLGQI